MEVPPSGKMAGRRLPELHEKSDSTRPIKEPDGFPLFSFQSFDRFDRLENAHSIHMDAK
jgi:hypothetical protein